MKMIFIQINMLKGIKHNLFSSISACHCQSIFRECDISSPQYSTTKIVIFLTTIVHSSILFQIKLVIKSVCLIRTFHDEETSSLTIRCEGAGLCFV